MSTTVGKREGTHRSAGGPPRKVAAAKKTSQRRVNHPSPVRGAAARRRSQLPSLAPIFDELEIAGWSSNRQELAGNFHDWLPLEGGRLLIVVGRSLISAADPVEAALVSQSVWTAVRAHAPSTDDAGTLLTKVGMTLGSDLQPEPLASLAAAIVDPNGGQANLAVAGDCLGLRIRAASSQRLALGGAALAAHAQPSYRSLSIDLRPRERLVLIAGLMQHQLVPCQASITNRFSMVSAESHRRMTAGDTLDLARQACEKTHRCQPLHSTSLVVIRRR